MGIDLKNVCIRKVRNHRQNIQAGLSKHHGGTDPIIMRINLVSGQEIIALLISVNLWFPSFFYSPFTDPWIIIFF